MGHEKYQPVGPSIGNRTWPRTVLAGAGPIEIEVPWDRAVTLGAIDRG